MSAWFGSLIHAGNAWHGAMFRHGLVRKLEPAVLQSQRAIMMRFYEIAS
jgi:hypothetical protein